MSVVITNAPDIAANLAVASPIPLPAPVTRTVRPDKVSGAIISYPR
jgi:hypothetical protein